MPQFDPQFFTPMLFWTAVSFVILLWLLKRYALPGIMEVMEGRQERIREDLESAEKLRRQGEAALAANEAKLQETKAAVDAVIAQAQDRAAALLVENEARMRQEADRVIAEAHRAIEQERGQAVTELRELAADLAVAVASKFVAQGLDREAQLKLVDDSLDELAVRYR